MASELAKESQKKNGANSYHFWHGKGGGEAPLLEPKKLTAEEAAELSQQLDGNSIHTSAWNKAGTFEERDYTSWAKERLKELLVGIEVPVRQGGSLRVTELATCSGDATIAVVRGKPRHGFDFEVKMIWKAEMPGGTVKGSATIPEASRETIADDEVVVQVKIDEEKDAAKAASRALQDAAATTAKAELRAAVVKKLAQLEEELRAKIEQGPISAPG